HTCGVKTDGTLACWGDNGFGQASPPSGSFTAITAGSDHTCGVKNDGTLACWGDNGKGQASAPSGSFRAVSTGDAHTCGVRVDGTVACWGSNESGRVSPPSASLVTFVVPASALGPNWSPVGQPTTTTIVGSQGPQQIYT